MKSRERCGPSARHARSRSQYCCRARCSPARLLLAKGADPLARTLPDEDAAEDAVGKTPLEVAKTEAVRELLREAEAAAEDAVLREAEDALKDEV